MSTATYCTGVIILMIFGSAYSQMKLEDLVQSLYGSQNTTIQPATTQEADLSTTGTAVNPDTTSTSPLNSCGYRRGNPKEYTESHAAFAEFPWMVAIKRMENIIPNLSTPVYICGGALIHPSVVITAAHCIEKYGNEKLIIRVGIFRQNNTNAALPVAQRSIKHSYVHPSYNTRNGKNDLALLILESPLEMQQHIGTVCMPDPKIVLDNMRCLVTGWGKSEYTNSTYAQNLKKIDVPIVPARECQEILRTTYLGGYYTLDSSFLCAGGEEGKDACSGDGGSPLVCPMAGAENRYYLAGLVSWGIQCGEKEIPGVYANVVTQRDWIMTTLETEGFANEISTT